MLRWQQREKANYADLTKTYLFQPLAFKALRAINALVITLSYDFCKCLSEVSGDARKSELMFVSEAVSDTQRSKPITFEKNFFCG